MTPADGKTTSAAAPDCPPSWITCSEDNPCPRHAEYWRHYKACRPAPVAPNDVPCPENERSATTAGESGIRPAGIAAPVAAKDEGESAICADTLVGCYCEGNALKVLQPLDWEAWQRVADYANAKLSAAADCARRELVEALDALYKDHHRWSVRPCETCAAVSKALGVPFGCDRMAGRALAEGAGKGTKNADNRD